MYSQSVLLKIIYMQDLNMLRDTCRSACNRVQSRKGKHNDVLAWLGGLSVLVAALFVLLFGV